MTAASVRVHLLLLLGAIWLAPAAAAAEGADRGVSPSVAEALDRYRLSLISSARHDPSAHVPALAFGPVAPLPPRRPARGDVHADVAGLARRACLDCHAEQARDVHTTRGNITCRQCHGADPIASSDHYFAPMNPVRRHAYVCAKCHQGASVSFATYVVHPPRVGPALRAGFPALYWADRFMLALIVGVMAVFAVHSLAWWLREWFVRRRTGA